MEVSVVAPTLSLSSFCVFPSGSAVSDVLERFVPQQDFYVTRNGRLSSLDQRLQHGAVYHLEPRLCGGKGGFGSMLRALGAQIEKTTNREACRDLSGRRLRDVNHEKEMAEWLKKQAEREAEKEQRRLERLQRKLAEPKHQFSDPQYQKQCHDLSERLEDSVLKGLQASSSAQVMPDEVSAAKRPNPGESKEPLKKKKKKEEEGVAMGSFWTGLGELDELLSSEDEDEDGELSSPSTSSSSCRGAGVAMTRRGEEARPELGGSSSDCSSSSTGPAVRPSVGKKHPETSSHSTKSPSEKPAEPISETPVLPSKVQKSPEPVSNTPVKPSEDQKPAEPVSDTPVRAPKVQTPPEPVSENSVKAPKVQTPPEPVSNTTVMPSKDQKPPESSGSSEQLDLTSLTSVQQLEVLGLDALKEQLMLRGLKCGGTLPERAARLFSVRGLTAAQIDPALLAKPAKGRRK